MKKPKELSLGIQFNEAIGYVKSSANYIYATIVIFFLASIAGFIFRDDLTFLNRLLQELIQRTEGLNTLEMTFFILQNNLQSSLIAIVLGLAFGIFPLITSILNGVVLGYVLGISYDVAGITSWWRILPHGIFELPAIFISFGIGLKLGFSIFARKNKLKEFKLRFYNSMNTLLMVIIPLLMIAAAIEGILITLLS